ncbi:aquaporin-12-like [Erinaceus europaeus]|uniref:Aquaporin n=1 Tax=Erinaceus europaeus TaxID=9365 RepID=A0A1S3AAN5_ERIEU|nr:aquaporin-12-like [Erinaceus europaeus]
MAGLNVSLGFFLATFSLCQAARWAAEALLPAGAWASFAREAVGAAQLGACCLELRALAELGPWAGGAGPDVALTLLFLLLLAHGATLDASWANPSVALQDFLLASGSPVGLLRQLAAQALGLWAAGLLTARVWAWELSTPHLLQGLMAQHCGSTLHTSVAHGALLEGGGTLLLHLALLRLRTSLTVYRVPVLAALTTALAYAVGPFTSAFFNPALAAWLTFTCSGHTWWEYVQVYWLGPLAGMLLAVLLYHGHLPRLFQRNLIYSQKSKYRSPRVRPAPGLAEPQTPAGGPRGRDLGCRGSGRVGDR